MVMAALTALKSTNFVLDIYFLWLFDCNELCGSRSEPLPNGILTSAGKSVGGQTCQFWLVQESRNFGRFATMPDRGEGVFSQNRPVSKKKQPVDAFQTGASFKQRCYAHGIRCLLYTSDAADE